MKLKKCIKRVSATLLAATMIVSGLPNQPKVNAEEFPEEILFPVSILDFRADNLFFEYAPSWSGNGHGDAFANLNSNGKGFVETHLESDPTSIYYGLPVYKEEKVKLMAELTKQQLGYNDSAATVLNSQYISGIINPLSARNYIRKTDWVVLDAEDTGKYKEDYTNGHYGGIKHYSELGGSAEIVAGNNTLQQYYVTNIGGAGKGTVTFKYYNEAGKGNYDIRFFGMTNQNGAQLKVTVNATDYIVNVSSNGSVDTPPQNSNGVLSGVPLVEGDNTIIVSGVDGKVTPNLDRIEIGTIKSSGAVGDPAQYTGEFEKGTYTRGNNRSNVTNNRNYHGNGYYDAGYWTHTNEYQYNFDFKDGTYDIWVYYDGGGNDWGAMYVNGTSVGGKNGLFPYKNHNTSQTTNPVVFSGVKLNRRNNRIQLDVGNSARFDYFEIHANTAGGGGSGEYPLGTYADSKAKYNVDRINNTTGAEEPDGVADYGWFDIETCYDYAYFISAHMFKSHPTLNKPYSDYNNLVFHKVDGNDTTPYYEFMGDQHHKGNNDGLIYSPNNKSIRNGSTADVKADEGEFRTKAGQMFIVDKVTKDYPDIDKLENDGNREKHNFHYTVRTHSRFVYKKGSDQTFYFSGDDDVYVFINGQLLIDMGGAHEQQDGTFNLDDLAEANPELDLKNGKAVDFDFFYVERHTTASNFYGKMNFKLASDEVSLEWPDDIKNLDDLSIPYGWVVDLNYRFESNRELTTNKNITFTDQLGDKIGADGFVLGDGIRLRDDMKLVVTVKRDGKADPEIHEFQFTDTKASVITEQDAVVNFFKELNLEQGDSVMIDGVIFDSSIKKFDDYDPTSDPRVRKLSFETRADYEMYMTMGGTNSVNDTVAIKNHVTQSQTVNLLMGALKVSTKIEGLGENIEARKDLSAYGKFTISRPETKDNPDTEEDERIVYQNQMDIARGDNVIVFDSVIPEPPEAHTIYEKALPRGRYKLNLDTTVLTGYDLSVEIRVTKPDGNVVDVEVMKGESKVLDGETYSFNSLYLDIEPEIINGKWVYPEVEYILKAVRKVNPLKDLT